LDSTLKAVSSAKTAFKMGHTIGVQDAISCFMEKEETIQGTSQSATAVTDEMAKDVAPTRNQTKYAQRCTEQVLDTLELVKLSTTSWLGVVETECQAKY
jgi:hypothetical protein